MPGDTVCLEQLNRSCQWSLASCWQMRLLFTCRTSFPPGETGSSSGFLEQNLGNGSERVGVLGFLHRVLESSYVPERGQNSNTLLSSQKHWVSKL